jgi:HK97 family phage major capsid protein
MNKKVLELRDKRGVILDKVDEIRAKAAADEKRSLTKEERDEIDGLLAQVEDLNEQIASAEVEARAEAAKLDAEIRTFVPGDRKVPVESRKNYEQWPVDEADQFVRSIIELGKSGNQRLPSGIHDDYRETFTEVLTGKRSITGAGTLVDQDGGFLVPSTVSSTVFRKVHEEGQLISRVDNRPITVGRSQEFNAITENSRAAGQRYGGITVARVAEGGSITASKPAFDRVKLELKKLACAVYLTEEQREDGPQLLNIVTELVPNAFIFDIEDEIYNGLGGPAMKGILNEACVVSVAKENGQAAATILFENIVKMEARMHASMASGAVWLVNQDIMPQLRTMVMAVGTGGVPVYLPPNGAAGTPFGSLLGKPIIPIEHAATLGTKGDIAYVNLQAYLYATGGGMKQAQSAHVRFLNDEEVLKWTTRNDGKAQWSSSLTPAKGSNALSPFVFLDTRA